MKRLAKWAVWYGLTLALVQRWLRWQNSTEPWIPPRFGK